MTVAEQSEALASLADLAALDFAPWTSSPGSWTPPSKEEWAALANPHLISVRLAWLTLQKSKEQIVAMVDELGDDALMELVARIGQSADWFEGLHKLLASAECRIMCAYAALAGEENPSAGS